MAMAMAIPPKTSAQTSTKRPLNASPIAMPAIAVMVTWKNVGFYVVIYLAGLQYVPRSCYEAISLDGAVPLASQLLDACGCAHASINGHSRRLVKAASPRTACHSSRYTRDPPRKLPAVV